MKIFGEENPKYVTSFMRSECPNLYYSKGSRSYGSDIPDNCQGVYFPGDEPGERCKLSGEGCFEGMDIDCCEKTDWPQEEI